MKKSKMATLLIVALIVTLIIGGIVMTVQNQNLFTDGVKREKKKEQDPRERQLAYLKKHKKDIEEYIKSLNPKIETVQIDWEQTQWDQIGNGIPQGGGDIIDMYGTFNNIEDSGWHVMVNVEDEKIDLDSMTLVNGLGIGGKPFE